MLLKPQRGNSELVGRGTAVPFQTRLISKIEDASGMH